MDINKKLFEIAKKYMVGGVNSPVRAFKIFDREPIFIKKAKGCYIYDENDKEYIDYNCGWGSLIFGHTNKEIIASIKNQLNCGIYFGTNNRNEIEFTELINKNIKIAEKIRLTNSGTEAVMTGIRLARAYTKREKIIKFDGSYHGHVDYLLVKSGSGSLTYKVKTSDGVNKEFIKNTIVLPYNNLEALEKVFKKYGKYIACIIVEPVMANCGVIIPEDGFLKGMRDLCDKYGSVLIFDEVITGFRLSTGGASEFFGVHPDILCLGKIIGGGFPIGAVCGKKEIMELLCPEGNVYQAGTFSGHPFILTAGIATIKKLLNERPYEKLEKKTEYLCEKIKNLFEDFNIPIRINYISSIFSIFFPEKKIMILNFLRNFTFMLLKKEFIFHHLLLRQIFYQQNTEKKK
ncbi:MAG: aspartate aminotransferase family protein [Candidatus Ratteibacteria bacterium]